MRRSLRKNTESISVRVHSIVRDGITLSVMDRDFFVPFDRVPWFRHSNVDDIMNVRMEGRRAIRWDKLDVDLEIDSLIHPEKYPLVMKRQIREAIV